MLVASVHCRQAGGCQAARAHKAQRDEESVTGLRYQKHTQGPSSGRGARHARQRPLHLRLAAGLHGCSLALLQLRPRSGGSKGKLQAPCEARRWQWDHMRQLLLLLLRLRLQLRLLLGLGLMRHELEGLGVRHGLGLHGQLHAVLQPLLGLRLGLILLALRSCLSLVVVLRALGLEHLHTANRCSRASQVLPCSSVEAVQRTCRLWNQHFLHQGQLALWLPARGMGLPSASLQMGQCLFWPGAPRPVVPPSDCSRDQVSFLRAAEHAACKCPTPPCACGARRPWS